MIKYELFRFNSLNGNEMTGRIVAESYALTYEVAVEDFEPIMEPGQRYIILCTK